MKEFWLKDAFKHRSVMGVVQYSGCKRTSLKVWGDTVVIVRQLLAFKLEQFKAFSLFSDRSYDLSDEMNVNTLYYNANETF